jgi:hypothetical protein
LPVDCSEPLKDDDRNRKVTVVAFTHGEDLRRLITAQQSAEAYTGRRE